MTEETKVTEKFYYLYRTFSGKTFSSDKKIPYAELISKSAEKQMSSESPEIKQSS